MNKKILSVVLILCVMLAVMPMTAYAADRALCTKCNQVQTVRMTSQYVNGKWHLFHVTCTVCNNEWSYGMSHEWSGTATCTSGRTCTVCGGSSEPLGHDWGTWTQNSDEKTHTRICKRDTSHTETENCHGGTATCSAKAVCTVCGGEYGEVDMTNHTDTTQWIQTETTHTQKYKCCGVIVVPEENHEWKDGVCTECDYECVHQYNWQSENGMYWQHCTICGFDTNKKAIPTIPINGADKVCRTQDYKFSFALPEGATDAAYGYEFIGLGDGPLTPTVEDNLYSGILKATIYPAEENSFKLIVSAKTADGFEFSAEKTVAIQNEHSGGTATCTEQATCEICGEKYGDLKPHSYSADWVMDETSHWHECTECGAKTDEAEHIDADKDHKCDICEKVLSECADNDKDHKCDICGKTLSEHSGGTATCKDKAKCEVCGESYGEPDADNHTDLQHFPAVANITRMPKQHRKLPRQTPSQPSCRRRNRLLPKPATQAISHCGSPCCLPAAA